MTATETMGCDRQEVEALFAPARGRIQECRGASGGKLVVRVREARGKMAFELLPGSSLDPSQKQCVLEALSQVSTKDNAALHGGAGIPPTGFTSVLTIEWGR